MIKPAVISSVLSIVILVTQNVIDLRGYVALVVAGFIYLLLYVSTILYMKDYLDEYDRALLYKLIRRSV